MGLDFVGQIGKMYGFAMANPLQSTVKIGLAMASPYAIPIFDDENRLNNPVIGVSHK
jgi:hypothetical protein